MTSVPTASRANRASNRSRAGARAATRGEIGRGARLCARLAALAAAGVVACGGGKDALELNHPYGASSAPSSSASAPPASLPVWSHFSEVRGWCKANDRRFPSAGHFFGRFDADIFVNDVGANSYASIGPGRSLPVGSIVVKVHTLPGAGGAAPTLAMEKMEKTAMRDAGWRYLELDEAGHVQREGRLHPCVDCHAAMASQDELFGVPTTGR